MPDAYLASSRKPGAFRHVVTHPRYRSTRTLLGGRRVARHLTSGNTDSVVRQRKLSNRDLQADFWKPGSSQGPWSVLRASEPRLCGESCSLLFALVSTTSAFLCQSSKSRIGWLCLADSAHRRSGGQHTQLHLGWTRILRQLGSDERIIHAFLALFFCSCIHSSLPKKNLKKNLGFFLHSARC